MAQFRIPNPEQFLPVVPGSQPLSFSTPAGTDPAFDRVQQLISMLETARPPEPQKLKTWQKIVGGLGDAIQAMAAVRAGGAPPALGPFAAQQLSQRRRFEEESRAAEEYGRELRNRVRIGAFEEQGRREREESLERLRAGSKEEQQAILNEFRARALDIQAQNATTAEERARFQGEANEIRRLLGEQGIALRGQALELQKMGLELRTTNRPLPASITQDIGEIDASKEAAETALSGYKLLGRPDLGFVFSKLTPERFADPKKIKARRIISEALVPIRKYFLGQAVTATEMQSARPLIANLEEGAPPNVLEESLIGLVNIAERGRRSRLQAAELAGFNVSNFPRTAPGQTAPPGQPTVTTPGGKTIKYRLNEQGQIVVEE